MHFVIMGCGRVGASLAGTLEHAGHEVAVVDQATAAFRRLPSDFAGLRVTGVGFDRDTLREAGIERAFAFAAVSSGDNSNILAARTALETFAVPHVVARIYDSDRAAIYQRLGIPTVATVRWTADQVMRHLMPGGQVVELTEPSGRLVLAEIAVGDRWQGTPISELERRLDARIPFLNRAHQAVLARPDVACQAGDVLHVMLDGTRLPEVTTLLTGATGASPAEG